MGRWGKGIYDSDAALDYQSTITDRLERELLYWLSPEQVRHNSGWLASVLAVIEVMLMFEQHEIGSGGYIEDESAVERWREVFLSVWDGDWQDDAHAFGDPAYRQQHHPAIIQMLDRLESIARFWTKLSSGSREELTPLSPDYPLPYFSKRRWTNRDNKEFVKVDRFTSYLIEHMAKDIIYWLSPEKRGEMLAFNAEEVWVLADALGYLCNIYEQTPGVNEQTVRAWRDNTVQIWKGFLEGDKLVWDETDELYQNVMRAFDRLEAVAQKYPPYEY
jgi:hypothetical protein